MASLGSAGSPSTAPAMLLLRSKQCEHQQRLLAEKKRKLRIRLWVGRSRGAKLRAMVKVKTVLQLEAWLEVNRKFIMSFKSSVQVQVVVGRES